MAISTIPRDALEPNVTYSVQPAGAIMMFAGPTPPIGWLKANGAIISRSVYADLFNAIGVYWGAGDGSTTFQLPDLRGEFLRCWDDARGADAGRALGTFQDYDWKTLYLKDAGQNSASNYVHSAISIKRLTEMGVNDGTVNLFTGYWSNNSAHINGWWGSEEVRPRNRSVLACIKY